VSAHTPGPWRVYHGDILDNNYGEMVADLDNRTLVVTDRPRLGNFEADARLIAAAPELYEALTLAREVIAGLPRSLAYDFTHLPKIDAALAKVDV
jgi:hypothetical protein